MVGDLIAIDHLADAICIGTPAEFVPRVVGQSIAIEILRNHDDPRLGRTRHVVATNKQVVLAMDIAHGMIKMEGDVAAVPTQGHQSVESATQGGSTFVTDGSSIISCFDLGQDVDKLPRSGDILVNGQNVRRPIALRWVVFCRHGARLDQAGMGGYVACETCPKPVALSIEAEEFARGDIVGGIHHIDAAIAIVDEQSIGSLYPLTGWQAEHLLAHEATVAQVVEATAASMEEEQGVATEGHVGGWHIQGVGHAATIQLIDASWYGVIIAMRGHPEAAVAIASKTEEVGCHVDGTLHREGLQIDYTHPTVVAASLHRTIASTVGHIEASIHDRHLFGLEAHRATCIDTKRQGINTIDLSQHAWPVHRSYIGGDIGVFPIKGEKTRVGNIDTTEAHRRGSRGHLHAVALVDDHPKA